MIAAIIPAHDEAARVEHAVVSLHRQTRPPERILVMSDDSTDATVEVALHAGAEVLLTVDNRHHRAGALNQALDTVRMEPDDLVLVLDPGVQLPPGFLARALAALRDRNVGAVSARSTGVMLVAHAEGSLSPAAAQRAQPRRNAPARHPG